MSSSMLVTSMEKAFKDLGIDAKIKAIPTALFMEERSRLGEYDYVLLAPQVRHYEGAVREALKNYPNLRLELINSRIFALGQGDELARKILEVLGRPSK